MGFVNLLGIMAVKPAAFNTMLFIAEVDLCSDEQNGYYLLKCVCVYNFFMSI